MILISDMKKNVKFRNDLVDDQFIFRIQFFTEDMPTYKENNESIDRVDLFIPTYERGHNGEFQLCYYTRSYNYDPTKNTFLFTDFAPVNSPNSTLVWEDQTITSLVKPLDETAISINTREQVLTLPKSASRFSIYSSNSNLTYTNIKNDLTNWKFTTNTTIDPIIVDVNHDLLYINDIENLPSIIPSINIGMNSSALQINDIYILTYSYDYDNQQVTVNYHKSSNLFRDTLHNDAFYSKMFNFDGSAVDITTKKTSFQVMNGWVLTDSWNLQKTIINSRVKDVTVGETALVNLAPLLNAQTKSNKSRIMPAFSCEKKVGLRFRCENSSLDIYFVNETILQNVSYDRIDVLIPTYIKENNTVSKFTYIRNIYGFVDNKIVNTGFKSLNDLDKLVYNVTPTIFPSNETRTFQDVITIQLHETAPSTIVRDVTAIRDLFGPTRDNASSVTVFDEYELNSGSDFSERGIYPAIKITPNFSITEPILVVTYSYDYDAKLVTITKHNVNTYLSSTSNVIESPSEVYTFNGNYSIPNYYLTPTNFNLLEGPPTFDKLTPAIVNTELMVGSKNYFNINPYFGTYVKQPFVPNNALFTSERKFKTLSHIYHSYEFIRNGNEIELKINDITSNKNQLSADRFDLFIPIYDGVSSANKLVYQAKSFGIDLATKKLVSSEFNSVISRNQTLFWPSTVVRKTFSSIPTIMFSETSQQLVFGKVDKLTKFKINNMNDYIEIAYNSIKLNIIREFGYFEKPLENIDPIFMLVYQYDYVNGYVIVTYHPLDQYTITPSNNYKIESRVFPFNGPMSVNDYVKTVTIPISPAALVSDDGFIGFGEVITKGKSQSVVQLGEKTDIDLTPLPGCSVCFV